MCGIAGVFSGNATINPLIIKDMTDVIHYRGPNDFGHLGYNSETKQQYFYKEPNDINNNYNLFLGHRRLSIIDLTEGAKQPMSFLDGRYWIVYNGEIYNYIEVRKELIRQGFSFTTNSDTEVILSAYHFWGADCLRLFNGMWAFAILDSQKNSLFIARDRLGIKPLYYAVRDNILLFSSEIKQILKSKLVPFKQNYKTLMDFFYFGTYNSIQEDTFFEGINELPGGSFFLVDLKKGAIEVNPQKYWEINLENKIRYKNDDQYSERYFEIFRNSVEIQLRSDVPVGSALSGGLDSSGIVCMISELMKEKNISQKQITFTATSDISQFDESFYANSVIKHANVEPYFTQPSHNQLLIDYSKLIWHQEEPFISTSIFAGWCVAKLVHENGVVVSLDGQGPDEMMGGYYPYASVLLQNIKSGNLSLFHSNLNYYRKQLNIHGINVILSIIRNSIPSSVKNTSKLFSNLFIDRHTIYKKEMWNGKLSLYQNKFPYEVKSKNPFDNYSFNSTRLQPLPGILKQVDRNSMAFSIESRVPFLDHRLVEFTFAIPIEQKVNGVSKYVYRNAIKHLLPNEINNRKSKLGFVTAEPIWLKNRNLSSLLNNSFENSDEDSIFNSDVISKQFNDFLKGERPFSADYWKFFNYLEWLKLFKNI